MRLRATITCVYDFEIKDTVFVRQVCDDYQKAYTLDPPRQILADSQIRTVNVEQIYDNP